MGNLKDFRELDGGSEVSGVMENMLLSTTMFKKLGWFIDNMKRGYDWKNLVGKVEEPYKSQGEVQIARLLDRHDIKYHYEAPLAVRDDNRVRIWYPDFQLPEHGIIIEYAGMNGNEQYDAMIEHKKKCFDEMGIPALFLTEASFKGYWPRKILGDIEEILEEKLAEYQGKVSTLKTKRRPGREKKCA